MPTLDLIVEQCLAPVPGGTGRYASQLGIALAATAPTGWRIRPVVAWHRSTAAAQLAGALPPFRLPAGRRMLTLAWEHGLPPWPGGDSVHATTPLAPGRRGRPLVATVHDVVPWTHPETLTPRGVAWHKRMIGRIAAQADAIVVPSRAVAEQLAARLPVGDRVRVIPHGVTALPVPADAPARRRRLGLPAEYLLTVSTLEPRKGLDVLIAAAARPASAGLTLAVVGPPGWGDLDLRTAAATAGLAPERLHVLGRIDDDDLAAVLAGSALLAVPSRAEGFGMPVLEGMAAGVPVVHTVDPALVEVAGGAGLAVPIGDADALAEAVRSVLDDPGRAAAMRQAGVARAREFSWATAAAATWDLHLGLGG